MEGRDDAGVGHYRREGHIEGRDDAETGHYRREG